MVSKQLLKSLLVLSAFLSPALLAQDARLELNARMIAVTENFLNSLTREQHNQAVFDFDDEERFNWHFIPRERNGAAFRDMTEEQLQAAHALLQTFFSESGYAQAEAVRNLETVLKEIEVDGRFERDPDNYYLTVFGEPAMDNNWALRYEGHHLAFNWTFVRGLGIASSPQFFGSNPAQVLSGSQAGLRVLAAEEDIARRLVESLTEQQASQAILDTEAPRDIITGANIDISRFDVSGIAAGDLNASQQGLLIDLIAEVASVQASALYGERMNRLRQEGTADLRFTWIGSTERGAPHYYRIQGANYVIEYDNVQNEANHIHLVWRDFEGDFGRDLLQLHYEGVAAVNGPGHRH